MQLEEESDLLACVVVTNRWVSVVYPVKSGSCSRVFKEKNLLFLAAGKLGKL